jgi:uncharacterized Fe-S radical SAM superfamily protein PflX
MMKDGVQVITSYTFSYSDAAGSLRFSIAPKYFEVLTVNTVISTSHVNAPHTFQCDSMT